MRLLNDDRMLQTLENDRKNKKISRRDFTEQHQELIACISEEADLKNAILMKQSTFSEHSDAVLRTIGKLAVEIPLCVLTGILKAGGSFSP